MRNNTKGTVRKWISIIFWILFFISVIYLAIFKIQLLTK